MFVEQLLLLAIIDILCSLLMHSVKNNCHYINAPINL